jgi:hypothetical protein
MSSSTSGDAIEHLALLVVVGQHRGQRVAGAVQ